MYRADAILRAKRALGRPLTAALSQISSSLTHAPTVSASTFNDKRAPASSRDQDSAADILDKASGPSTEHHSLHARQRPPPPGLPLAEPDGTRGHAFPSTLPGRKTYADENYDIDGFGSGVNAAQVEAAAKACPIVRDTPTHVAAQQAIATGSGLGVAARGMKKAAQEAYDKLSTAYSEVKQAKGHSVPPAKPEKSRSAADEARDLKSDVPEASVEAGDAVVAKEKENKKKKAEASTRSQAGATAWGGKMNVHAPQHPDADTGPTTAADVDPAALTRAHAAAAAAANAASTTASGGSYSPQYLSASVGKVLGGLLRPQQQRRWFPFTLATGPHSPHAAGALAGSTGAGAGAVDEVGGMRPSPRGMLRTHATGAVNNHHDLAVQPGESGLEYRKRTGQGALLPEDLASAECANAAPDVFVPPSMEFMADEMRPYPPSMLERNAGIMAQHLQFGPTELSKDIRREDGGFESDRYSTRQSVTAEMRKVTGKAASDDKDAGATMGAMLARPDVKEGREGVEGIAVEHALRARKKRDEIWEQAHKDVGERVQSQHAAYAREQQREHHQQREHQQQHDEQQQQKRGMNGFKVSASHPAKEGFAAVAAASQQAHSRHDYQQQRKQAPADHEGWAARAENSVAQRQRAWPGGTLRRGALPSSSVDTDSAAASARGPVDGHAGPSELFTDSMRAAVEGGALRQVQELGAHVRGTQITTPVQQRDSRAAAERSAATRAAAASPSASVSAGAAKAGVGSKGGYVGPPVAELQRIAREKEAAQAASKEARSEFKASHEARSMPEYQSKTTETSSQEAKVTGAQSAAHAASIKGPMRGDKRFRGDLDAYSVEKPVQERRPPLQNMQSKTPSSTDKPQPTSFANTTEAQAGTHPNSVSKGTEEAEINLFNSDGLGAAPAPKTAAKTKAKAQKVEFTAPRGAEHQVPEHEDEFAEVAVDDAIRVRREEAARRASAPDSHGKEELSASEVYSSGGSGAGMAGNELWAHRDGMPTASSGVSITREEYERDRAERRNASPDRVHLGGAQKAQYQAGLGGGDLSTAAGAVAAHSDVVRDAWARDQVGAPAHSRQENSTARVYADTGKGGSVWGSRDLSESPGSGRVRSKFAFSKHGAEARKGASPIGVRQWGQADGGKATPSTLESVPIEKSSRSEGKERAANAGAYSPLQATTAAASGGARVTEHDKTDKSTRHQRAPSSSASPSENDWLPGDFEELGRPDPPSRGRHSPSEIDARARARALASAAVEDISSAGERVKQAAKDFAAGAARLPTEAAAAVASGAGVHAHSTEAGKQRSRWHEKRSTAEVEADARDARDAVEAERNGIPPIYSSSAAAGEVVGGISKVEADAAEYLFNPDYSPIYEDNIPRFEESRTHDAHRARTRGGAPGVPYSSTGGFTGTGGGQRGFSTVVGSPRRSFASEAGVRNVKPGIGVPDSAAPMAEKDAMFNADYSPIYEDNIPRFDSSSAANDADIAAAATARDALAAGADTADARRAAAAARKWQEGVHSARAGHRAKGWAAARKEAEITERARDAIRVDHENAPEETRHEGLAALKRSHVPVPKDASERARLAEEQPPPTETVWPAYDVATSPAPAEVKAKAAERPETIAELKRAKSSADTTFADRLKASEEQRRADGTYPAGKSDNPAFSAVAQEAQAIKDRTRKAGEEAVTVAAGLTDEEKAEAASQRDAALAWRRAAGEAVPNSPTQRAAEAAAAVAAAANAAEGATVQTKSGDEDLSWDRNKWPLKDIRTPREKQADEARYQAIAIARVERARRQDARQGDRWVRFGDGDEAYYTTGSAPSAMEEAASTAADRAAAFMTRKLKAQAKENVSSAWDWLPWFRKKEEVVQEAAHVRADSTARAEARQQEQEGKRAVSPGRLAQARVGGAADSARAEAQQAQRLAHEKQRSHEEEERTKAVGQGRSSPEAGAYSKDAGGLNAEQARDAVRKAADAKRVEDEKAATDARKTAERIAKEAGEKRAFEAKAAEAERKAAADKAVKAAEEKKAADAKKAAEIQATSAKKAAEAKAAEVKRAADAKVAEEKKAADAKKATEAKAAEVKRAAEIKAAEEKKAADAKKAAESKAAEARAAAEATAAAEAKAASDKRASDAKVAEAKRISEKAAAVGKAEAQKPDLDKAVKTAKITAAAIDRATQHAEQRKPVNSPEYAAAKAAVDHHTVHATKTPAEEARATAEAREAADRHMHHEIQRQHAHAQQPQAQAQQRAHTVPTKSGVIGSASPATGAASAANSDNSQNEGVSAGRLRPPQNPQWHDDVHDIGYSSVRKTPGKREEAQSGYGGQWQQPQSNQQQQQQQQHQQPRQQQASSFGTTKAASTPSLFTDSPPTAAASPVVGTIPTHHTPHIALHPLPAPAHEASAVAYRSASQRSPPVITPAGAHTPAPASLSSTAAAAAKADAEMRRETYSPIYGSDLLPSDVAASEMRGDITREERRYRTQMLQPPRGQGETPSGAAEMPRDRVYSAAEQQCEQDMRKQANDYRLPKTPEDVNVAAARDTLRKGRLGVPSTSPLFSDYGARSANIADARANGDGVVVVHSAGAGDAPAPGAPVVTHSPAYFRAPPAGQKGVESVWTDARGAAVEELAALADEDELAMKPSNVLARRGVDATVGASMAALHETNVPEGTSVSAADVLEQMEKRAEGRHPQEYSARAPASVRVGAMRTAGRQVEREAALLKAAETAPAVDEQKQAASKREEAVEALRAGEVEPALEDPHTAAEALARHLTTISDEEARWFRDGGRLSNAEVVATRAAAAAGKAVRSGNVKPGAFASRGSRNSITADPASKGERASPKLSSSPGASSLSPASAVAAGEKSRARAAEPLLRAAEKESGVDVRDLEQRRKEADGVRRDRLQSFETAAAEDTAGHTSSSSSSHDLDEKGPWIEYSGDAAYVTPSRPRTRSGEGFAPPEPFPMPVINPPGTSAFPPAWQRKDGNGGGPALGTSHASHEAAKTGTAGGKTSEGVDPAAFGGGARRRFGGISALVRSSVLAPSLAALIQNRRGFATAAPRSVSGNVRGAGEELQAALAPPVVGVELDEGSMQPTVGARRAGAGGQYSSDGGASAEREREEQPLPWGAETLADPVMGTDTREGLQRQAQMDRAGAGWVARGPAVPLEAQKMMAAAVQKAVVNAKMRKGKKYDDAMDE